MLQKELLELKDFFLLLEFFFSRPRFKNLSQVHSMTEKEWSIIFVLAAIPLFVLALVWCVVINCTDLLLHLILLIQQGFQYLERCAAPWYLRPFSLLMYACASLLNLLLTVIRQAQVFILFVITQIALFVLGSFAIILCAPLQFLIYLYQKIFPRSAFYQELSQQCHAEGAGDIMTFKDFFQYLSVQKRKAIRVKIDQIDQMLKTEDTLSESQREQLQQLKKMVNELESLAQKDQFDALPASMASVHQWIGLTQKLEQDIMQKNQPLNQRIVVVVQFIADSTNIFSQVVQQHWGIVDQIQSTSPSKVNEILALMNTCVDLDLHNLENTVHTLETLPSYDLLAGTMDQVRGDAEQIGELPNPVSKKIEQQRGAL